MPVEYRRPVKEARRHKHGSNIMFMDHHGEAVNQEYAFNKLLFSWTEPVATP